MTERARRSPDSDEHTPTTTVLYIDADAATRERIRAAMTDHRPSLSVSGVASVAAALDLVSETVPACLIVDPDGLSDVPRILDTVSCPILLYTRQDPSALDRAIVETADSVIEKGGSRRGEFLAEKAVSATDVATGRSEYAFEAALEEIHSRADEIDVAMLLDDGRLIWSSEPPERILGDTDETATVYERLAERCETTGGRSPVAQLRTDPTAPVRVQIDGDGDDEQHQLWRGYDLPEDAGSLRLLLVSEVSDRARRQARLSRLELLVERAQDGLYTLDERGIIDFCNDSFAEMLGYDRAEEVIGKHAAETLAPGELEKGQETIEELLAADSDDMMAELTFVRTDGTEFEASIHYTLLRDDAGAYNGLMGVLRDVSEQNERQRTLESQRDDLATLAQVHVLIQDVIRALGTATTRAEIEENVCSQLVDSELYELAWVGEREASSDRIICRTVAGGESLPNSIAEQASESTDNPVAASIEDGTVRVVDDISTDEQSIPWRAAALDRGLRSAVVVPLRHDGVIHGVLTVCASQQAVFSGRAVDAFATLGEMVGFAVTALQSRQLLTEDRVVEMEFQSVDDSAYPVATARAHNAVFRRSGGVAVGDEVLEYLTVEDVAPAAALETLLAQDAVQDGRVIRSEDDSGVIELRMIESYESVLLDAGARLVDIVADADGVHVTLEAPTDAEPRTIETALTDHAPGFELVAKQERERRDTVDATPSSLREELTDRQLEVLRAASLAGYYEWPRDTTAEELAETLDIASPTLHQHLRRAERNVVNGLLDN